MKRGLYAWLAFVNIKKNYRFFVPRILAEAGLTGSFYIILTLAMDGRLAKIRGGDYIPTFMWMGAVIIGLLSAVLMFYINSFVMKQRTREFGLYNILGMEKRHVGKILFYETAESGLIAVLSGTGFGILLYKLCSLFICRLLKADIIIGFYFINLKSILPTVLLFVILDFFICLKNRIRISLLKPVELLKTAASGEKEPGVKWVLFILGLVFISAGYYISVTTKNPIEAICFFFIAVLFVIIGTYFLFVSGSIFVLKLLKRNKKYYYDKNRMPAVAGLLYRMKQNAVGLASIAILACGVLVMISTTVSLYAGIQDFLGSMYPQQMYISNQITVIDSEGSTKHISLEDNEYAGLIKEAAGETGLRIKEMKEQKYLEVAFLVLDNGILSTDIDGNKDRLSEIATFIFISEDVYRELGGKPLDLEKNEIAFCTISLMKRFTGREVCIGDLSLEIRENIDSFPVKSPMISSVSCFGVVVSDASVLEAIHDYEKGAYSINASEYTDRFALDFENDEEAAGLCKKFRTALNERITTIISERFPEYKKCYSDIESVWESEESIRGMYGTLLFLGIILGFVCLFSTVLIIYYKQISEGYEDRSRFLIMEKIGMSREEVRKTVNKQIILVFFLPLMVSGIHFCFAFPILDKLLHLMLLSDTVLFIVCAIIVYILFAGIYTIIYTLTARTYYKIVH